MPIVCGRTGGIAKWAMGHVNTQPRHGIMRNSVTFGSDRIRTYRGEDEKVESGGQLSTVLTRTHAGGTRARQEETKDGRSRARGSERSEEPQTETREN